MADSARKRSALRSAGHAAGAPARKAGRRYGAAPLTISRPELIVNGSDREFRELVHNLFGFFALHERVRSGHGKFIGLAGIEYTVLIVIARRRAMSMSRWWLIICTSRVRSSHRRRAVCCSSDSFTRRWTQSTVVA
jgi:hypothetical protein